LQKGRGKRKKDKQGTFQRKKGRDQEAYYSSFKERREKGGGEYTTRKNSKFEEREKGDQLSWRRLKRTTQAKN